MGEAGGVWDLWEGGKEEGTDLFAFLFLFCSSFLFLMHASFFFFRTARESQKEPKRRSHEGMKSECHELATSANFWRAAEEWRESPKEFLQGRRREGSLISRSRKEVSDSSLISSSRLRLNASFRSFVLQSRPQPPRTLDSAHRPPHRRIRETSGMEPLARSVIPLENDVSSFSSTRSSESTRRRGSFRRPTDHARR